MLLCGITLASAALAVVLFCLTGFTWWVLPVALVGGFLGLLVLAFLFLWAACAVVDFNKPQLHDSKFYRAMANLYIQALPILAGIHIERKGLEQLPQDGRFLLVCNHLSDADPVLLLQSFPKAQLAFISKRENQSMFLIGKIMHKLMCQMINRENDREALKTILKCIQLIKDDEVSVAVFPEGYTSRDGRLQHFRAGAFKIAMKTGVPIVVCTIAGSQHIFHNLAHLRPSQVKLHLVGVISPEEQKGRTAVEISEQCYQMMLQDLGPEYAPIDN